MQLMWLERQKILKNISIHWIERNIELKFGDITNKFKLDSRWKAKIQEIGAVKICNKDKDLHHDEVPNGMVRPKAISHGS